MIICGDCVKFESISSFINENGNRVSCDYCGKSRIGIDDEDIFKYISDKLDKILIPINDLLTTSSLFYHANEDLQTFDSSADYIDNVFWSHQYSDDLIRWNSKELGLISPSVFIPIAEANGAIKEIGWWVIEEACSTILEMSQSGFVGHISINVSAKQLTSKNFATQLISILKQRNISPSLIMLELTETVLVTDIITVKQVMEQLAEKGILFSVDDFGTGYSSLTYLKELPIHELKIDKYFVDEIMNGSSTLKYPIVDTIINMAAALNVRCVAEGVEHKKQFDYLNNNGCTLFQGYFFSKPLPKTELINLQLTSKDSL